MNYNYTFKELTPIANGKESLPAISPKNALYSEIEKLTKEQIHYAKAGVDEKTWELFCQGKFVTYYNKPNNHCVLRWSYENVQTRNGK